MTKILHLSDLHFGTEIPKLVNLVVEDFEKINPDIIVVSGDLTQRAKHSQYRDAKLFLDHFKSKPIICVPGNHDISLYNPFARFFNPFGKYKKWISPNLCTSYSGHRLSILGINSVTPYKPMGGYVTDEQLKLVRNFFETEPKENIRIVVMHHNLIKSERHKIINDADKILTVFADVGVNLILSGHIHFSYIEQVKKSFLKHHLYVITAGTAISTRTLLPNAYNIIEITNNHFSFIVNSLKNDSFVQTSLHEYPLR